MPPPVASAVRYRLADHVRACFVDGQVILLDLQRSKYLGVVGPQLQVMSQVIVDWPPSAGASAALCETAPPDAWLAKLLGQRMLIPATEAGVQYRQVDEPLASLNAELHRSPHRWHHLARLCWSATVASHWLRRLSLADIACAVRRLRRGIQEHIDAAQPQELRNAVASYTRLRPFVFTAHDQCLHDSLSLIRFLAMEGMTADWVIGVRARPFGAHSWVQSGSLVLNDVHENVRAYRPILVV